MKILVVDNHSEHLGDLKKVLEKYRAPYIIVDQRALFNGTKNLYNISGVILSGGGPELNQKIDLSSIRADIASVLNFSVPVFGICEGHQILGEIFGGDVLERKNELKRKVKVKLKKRKFIFEGLPEIIEGYENHGRYVRNVPFSMDVVASSREDRVEAMFHKTKPIFSVQFHPEKSGENGEKIIKNFLDICRHMKVK